MCSSKMLTTPIPANSLTPLLSFFFIGFDEPKRERERVGLIERGGSRRKKEGQEKEREIVFVRWKEGQVVNDACVCVCVKPLEE